MLTDHNWILTAGVFAPLVGVFVMFFIPKEEEALNKAVALFFAGLTLVFGIATLAWFKYGSGDSAKLQFHVDVSWIPVIKSRYIIGLDGVSLPLYILSMLITLLVMIYSWDHIPEPGNAKAFMILMLILQTGMAGTFVAQDLILFFVFFEVVLLPMYFMIGVWGGEQRQYASLKFFLYTMFGSALMLVAFLALFFQTGAKSFSLEYLYANSSMVSTNVAVWIFAGMFVGFAVKVPMFPFHTWLPDAHTQAPTQGSVILAAILLKLGTYGFIRIAIPTLPQAAVKWAPVIGVLAVVGIIYGALGCMAQTDMKRLIAFSSVAHMGFVMLGISTLTQFGVNAAVFGMVAHGLITGMLFFLAGSIKNRYHTLEIAKLGGILKRIPRLGWILGMCAMASLGLPGLAGFWGEFPAILSAYSPFSNDFVHLSQPLFRTLMVVAAFGTVLAAGYLLWLFQRVAFGEASPLVAGEVDAEGHDLVHAGAHDAQHGGAHGQAVALSVGAAGNDDPHAEVHDVSLFEWLAWTPMLIGIVVFGVYPDLMFKIMDSSVGKLLAPVKALTGK